jgi:hypothetical protein
VCFIHKRVQFICTALRAATANTSHSFSRDNSFITRNTRWLVTSYAGRDTITHTIPRTFNRTATNTAKCFKASIAAAVTQFRYRAGVKHEGSIRQFDFATVGIACHVWGEYLVIPVLALLRVRVQDIL